MAVHHTPAFGQPVITREGYRPGDQVSVRRCVLGVDNANLNPRDPEEVARMLWKASHVGPELYVRWSCPCCYGPKAICAPDNYNHVWMILVWSTRVATRDVVRLDAVHEVKQLLKDFPCVDDRQLLANWYPNGLEELLLQQFGS